ncbi:MAG: hypothetical protein PHW10_03435 [Candidatus Peribacteraceae bacterium]|nr:hypothetical protein [Candidatus Peribacteraceae bacterium]
MTFGKGTLLRQHSPYLRKASDRHARILDVAERNSVIEGLPKFSRQMKQKVSRKLKRLSAR